MIFLIAALAAIALVCFGLARLIDGRSARVRARVINEFRPDDFFVDVGGSVIGFRLEDQTIIYGKGDRIHAVPARSLISVDVRKDEVSVTKINRGSQLAGAAIGTLTFGIPGAIVGGLSGSSSTAARVKSIGLAFTFNQLEDPFHVVIFGAWPGQGVPEHGILADKAVSDLERLRARAIAALQTN